MTSPTSPLSGLRRIARTAESALGAVALRAHRRPRVALAIVVLVTAVSAWQAQRLRLDSDLTALLPKTFTSIQDIKALSQHFGGVGWVEVVGRDAPPDALRRFADDLAPKLAALKFVRYVDYKRPAEFFEDRALYFLSPDDLKAVRGRLERRVAWEKQHHNPLYVDLEDSLPPPLDFADITGKMARGEATGGSSWLSKQVGKTYYIDESKRIIALLAKPASQSIDMAFSIKMVDEVQKLVDSIDLKKYGPHMRVELTGRYKNRVELQRMLARDLRLASVVAVALVLLFLFVHFRRFLTVGMVLMPLLIGLAWTFGFTEVVFGRLNILTGYVGAIMLGLGIDHGIHLLGRYEFELGGGSDAETAVARTFGETGRAVIVAAGTTMVGFLSLGLSEFRAFREFGIVAAAGMVLTVLAYTVALPASLGLAGRWGFRPRALAKVSGSRLPLLLRRFAPAITVVSLVVLGAALWGSSKGQFDYSFKALESNNLPSFAANREVNEVLGYTFVPVALLTDSLDEERFVTAKLRRTMKDLGPASTFSMVASSSDLVPTHQAAKEPLIRDIGEAIRGVKAAWIKDPDARRQFKALERMVRAKPFTVDDLPMQLRLLFRGVTGRGQQGFVLVFPRVSMGNGKDVLRYARQIRSVHRRDGGRVPAAGEDLILADILTMVMHEAPGVLLTALVAVALTLVLLLGSLREGLLCLVPAAFGLILTLGLLPLVGLELNYLDMVMIPVLFGMGVDGGAHLITRTGAGQPLDAAFEETGRGIAGSILTSMLGFGTLILAHHHGLNTLGALSVLGLCANALASLVVLPALLEMWHARRPHTRVEPLPGINNP